MNDISFEIPDSDERGVSPVIGVILMVAITVILAAVIASFVLGFGGSVSNNAQAGVTVGEPSGGNVEVTLTSLGDNTEGIFCSGSPSTDTTQVGGSITCGVGENVVAFTGDGTETVVRTDVGN